MKINKIISSTLGFAQRRASNAQHALTRLFHQTNDQNASTSSSMEMKSVARKQLSRETKDAIARFESEWKDSDQKQSPEFCDKVCESLLPILDQVRVEGESFRALLNLLDQFGFTPQQKMKLYAVLADSGVDSPLVKKMVQNQTPFSSFADPYKIVFSDGRHTVISVGELRNLGEYFEALLNSGFEESNSRELVLDVEASHIEFIIQFFKGEEIETSDEETLEAAKLLALRFGIREMSKYLHDNIQFASMREYIGFVFEHGLKELDLSRWTITDRDIHNILSDGSDTKWFLIEKLIIKSPNVTDLGIVAIADKFSGVRELDISRSQISDNALIVVAEKLPKLIKLDVSGCVKLSDKGLLAVANLTELEELEFNDCTDKVFSKITDVTLSAIANKLTSLKKLGMSRCSVSDKGILEIMSKLKGIQRLNMNFLPHGVTIDAIAAHLTDLRELNFSNAGSVKDESIKALVEHFPDLEVLHLNSVSLSAESGLLIANNLPALRALSLSFSVNNEMLSMIAANHSDLQELNLNFCEEVDQLGVRELVKLKNLKKLELLNCKGIDDNCVSMIGANLKELEELVISGLTNRGLGIIGANLTNLRCLSIFLSNITKKGLRTISKLPHLRSLLLSHCDLVKLEDVPGNIERVKFNDQWYQQS